MLVGLDGSDGALRALRWAADHARAHGATLVAVVAWEPPVLSTIPVLGVTEPAEEVESELRSGLDATLAGEGLGPDGDVDVETLVVQGHAAEILTDSAGPGDVIVVGSRGRGGFAGLILGSVSQHVMHHARCPVVVVPPVAS